MLNDFTKRYLFSASQGEGRDVRQWGELKEGGGLLVYSVTNDKNGKEAKEETESKSSRIR